MTPPPGSSLSRAADVSDRQLLFNAVEKLADLQSSVAALDRDTKHFAEQLETHFGDHRALKRARWASAGSLIVVALAAVTYLLSTVTTHIGLAAQNRAQDTTLAAVAAAAITSCYYAEEADTLIKLTTPAGGRVVRIRSLPSCAMLEAGLAARLGVLFRRQP